jgi:glycosyltransferase involved in cell wall biosynthesis
MSDGSSWPRVSIVTPSYNQAQFIEETIRSVLLQGYPNLEYIIMDGGSSDDSVEIIQRYEPWLSYWVSAPDEGQVHAVKDGWARSTGSILAYLNSDDTYFPGAVHSAAQHLCRRPGAAAVCGGELLIDKEGFALCERLVPSASADDLMQFNFIPQPAVFSRRASIEKAGGLDTSFGLVFDFELWTRLAQVGEIHCVPEVYATTRWYQETRTLSQRPAVISGLERVFDKMLKSPWGRQVPRRKRRIMRARLSYVACDVYLDSIRDHGGALIASMVKAIGSWPPITSDLIWLIAAKTLPPVLRVSLRNWQRRLARQEPLRPLSRQRIPWSEWTLAQQQEPDEAG